jgi:hypothetical protein
MAVKASVSYGLSGLVSKLVVPFIPALLLTTERVIVPPYRPGVNTFLTFFSRSARPYTFYAIPSHLFAPPTGNPQHGHPAHESAPTRPWRGRLGLASRRHSAGARPPPHSSSVLAQRTIHPQPSTPIARIWTAREPCVVLRVIAGETERRRLPRRVPCDWR